MNVNVTLTQLILSIIVKLYLSRVLENTMNLISDPNTAVMLWIVGVLLVSAAVGGIYLLSIRSTTKKII